MIIGGITFTDEEVQSLSERFNDPLQMTFKISARYFRKDKLLQKAHRAGLLNLKSKPVIVRDLRRPKELSDPEFWVTDALRELTFAAL